MISIGLFALGGACVGGAYSLYKQGATRRTIAVVAVIAALATMAGLLWLLPGRG